MAGMFKFNSLNLLNAKMDNVIKILNAHVTNVGYNLSLHTNVAYCNVCVEKIMMISVVQMNRCNLLAIIISFHKTIITRTHTIGDGEIIQILDGGTKRTNQDHKIHQVFNQDP